ncbi:DUF4129 domain-containing protein [Actinospica sp.]|uniref:DUF4129 domain-containing protein n=1 Tax=Actinospica sp. TaxID=1872142 RepID=UPI002CE47E8C|nr:DUF4129 domain-containing protein [Actinospica sp.]HWG23241.1 DUF4129 domain-containing protein [Actinospica sp.]
MSAISDGAPITPGREQASQQAARELAQGKYHVQPTSPSPTPSTSSPTPTVSTPSPTPTSNTSHHSSGGTILLVILLIVIVGIALLLILRKIGKPRKDEKTKKDKDKAKHLAGGASETPLFGAALHRHNAAQAAKGGDWQQAIRERFRAVIAVLDERSLLPERKDRTADEAARDAGELLPEHAETLRDAARAFDEVEYGDYLGTPEGYAVISRVDDAVGSAVRT